MDFQQKLQSLVQRIEGKMPQEYLQIMHGATQDLINSGIQDRVLKVNETLPAFTLANQAGAQVASAQLLQQGPIVLTFYRGFWCPYCNTDLANLNKYVAQIRELGAELVAISPELPQYSQKVIDTQRLGYDILHDPSNQGAETIGLKWFMVDPLKSLYRDQFSISLNEYHGDEEWSLPMPARVLVDKAGTIRYIESEPDYRKRPDPDALIEVLKTL